MSRTSHMLERVPVFLEITEGLALLAKRRLKTARLPVHPDRQDEGDGLSLRSFALGNDPDVLEHKSTSHFKGPACLAERFDARLSTFRRRVCQLQFDAVRTSLGLRVIHGCPHLRICPRPPVCRFLAGADSAGAAHRACGWG
jgi:hypothetical protein